MSSVVLDSSAILALVNEEDGSDLVRSVLTSAVMSAVNAAEVYSKLNEYTSETARTARVLLSFVEIVPFSNAQARVTGDLRADTRKAGLSIGDRACIALAFELGREIYTADGAWSKLGLPCAIRMIRGVRKSVQ